jgi:uroporphyrinogen-III synthase
MSAPPIFVLRPEPGGSATVAAARALGLEAQACPLFAVAPLAWSPPPADAFDALVLTSANAVRHGGNALARYTALPVHVVGQATAAAARGAGFSLAGVHNGAQSLFESLGPAGTRNVLWLCGEDRSAVDPGALHITALPVYAARPIDPPAPFAALGTAAPAIVLVHSVRAGERLAALVEHRASVAIAAISDKVAQACGDRWARIAVAAEPTGEAVLELARRMCQTTDCKHPAGQ